MENYSLTLTNLNFYETPGYPNYNMYEAPIYDQIDRIYALCMVLWTAGVFDVIIKKVCSKIGPQRINKLINQKDIKDTTQSKEKINNKITPIIKMCVFVARILCFAYSAAIFMHAFPKKPAYHSLINIIGLMTLTAHETYNLTQRLRSLTTNLKNNKEIEALKGRIITLNEKNETLENKHKIVTEEQNKKIKSLNETIQNRENTSERLTSELVTLRYEKEKLRGEKEKLLEKNIKKSQSLNEALKKIRQQNEQQISIEENLKIKNQIKFLTGQNEQQKIKIDEQNNAISVMKKKTINQQLTIKKTTKENEQLKRKRDSLQQKIELLHSRIELLNQNLQEKQDPTSTNNNSRRKKPYPKGRIHHRGHSVTKETFKNNLKINKRKEKESQPPPHANNTNDSSSLNSKNNNENETIKTPKNKKHRTKDTSKTTNSRKDIYTRMAALHKSKQTKSTQGKKQDHHNTNPTPTPSKKDNLVTLKVPKTPDVRPKSAPKSSPTTKKSIYARIAALHKSKQTKSTQGKKQDRHSTNNPTPTPSKNSRNVVNPNLQRQKRAKSAAPRSYLIKSTALKKQKIHAKNITPRTPKAQKTTSFKIVLSPESQRLHKDVSELSEELSVIIKKPKNKKFSSNSKFNNEDNAKKTPRTNKPKQNKHNPESERQKEKEEFIKIQKMLDKRIRKQNKLIEKLNNEEEESDSDAET